MLVSIAAGLAFGLAVAAINTAILRMALRKNSAGGLAGAVMIRFLLDLLALGAVYITRDRLPLQFEPALMATAVGLSAGVVALAVMTSRKKKPSPSDETGGE